MIENYIGNYETVKALNNWLQQHFDTFCNGEPKLEPKPYVILHGSSGNGKTFLIECLAHDYNLDFLRFTADDFGNVNTLEKSINLQSLNSDKQKLILFDDIEDIKNKRRLYKMWETSRYPIVYITNDLGELDNDFKENGLILKIKRPLNFEIKQLLEKKLKELIIECKDVDEIASQSVSVRTALQGLLMDCIIVKKHPNNNIYRLVNLMAQRLLNEDIGWYTILNAFKNIKGIDIKSYKLMSKFAEMDYVTHVEHFGNKEILFDFLFFNFLKDIELVKPTFEEKKKTNNKKSKTKEEGVEEVVVEQSPSVDSYF